MIVAEQQLPEAHDAATAVERTDRKADDAVEHDIFHEKRFKRRFTHFGCALAPPALHDRDRDAREKAADRIG